MIQRLQQLAKNLAHLCYDVSSWLLRNVTDLVANTLGLAIGLVIAPIQLIAESISGRNVEQHREQRPPETPAAEALVMPQRPAAVVPNFERPSTSDLRSSAELEEPGQGLRAALR